MKVYSSHAPNVNNSRGSVAVEGDNVPGQGIEETHRNEKPNFLNKQTK